MPAPIAGGTAGLSCRLFTSSRSNPRLVVPVGMWAKASISPLSELAREAGEAQPGRQRRSSIYPWAFLVDLSRRAITQALVLALGVVKVQPGANNGPGFGDTRISMQVDLLVFETAPQPLDKDVVHERPLPSMPIVTPCRFRVPVKSSTGELAASVGIEDFRVGDSARTLPRAPRRKNQR